MPFERTREQEAVVQNRGGSLLVSAAAGSGKTRVLVERLMERIVKEEKNLDSFLIITFTRAAAEELRGRIAKELSQKRLDHPENAHLRHQTALLYQTQISTIHALCTQLIRQWGHLLDIATDFVLCEEEDAVVFMARVLNDVLELRYQEMDPEGEFAQLVDILSAGRDDRRLMEIVLDVYGKIQSHPNPDDWLMEQEVQWELAGVSDAGDTPWGNLLLENAARIAAYWAEQMKLAEELTAGDPVLERAYGESLRETQGDLETYCAACHSWEEAAATEISFPRLKSARGVQDTAAQERIKSIRTRCKGAVQALYRQISGSSEALLEDMALVRPAMRGLFSLVKDFSTAYQREKREKNLLDFSDLEHIGAKLLTNPDGSPTELAQTWGHQYTEIMVDEYQDTNQVQNTIFQALSQQGENLFLVGDVKQSIYRFRLADPTIFLHKYKTYVPSEQANPGQPRKITMSQNFRSRPQVLEAANYLFRNLMSEQLGEMSYTDQEVLHAGGTFPDGGGYETEYHVLDLKDDPAIMEDKLNRTLLEARFVARRIGQMLLEKFPVSDGQGGTRSLQPDDIAILLRSPGTVRQYYTMALTEALVPWTAENGGDFFRSTEISVALSWLQIIDNPRQDIPLLSVLRSPVWGFTPDRLAELRSAAPEGEYYSALQRAAERGEEDCILFLEDLTQLQFAAGELSSHQLLWRLYQQGGLLDVFGAMPGGEIRKNNLLAFYELAKRFEGNGHWGLFPFLLHLRRVRENGATFSAPAGKQTERGVHILSIHRSKGLEYPVVFLCGLGKRWNQTDLQKPVLFHPKLGLGPKGVDPKTMIEFSTLARAGVGLQLKKEMLAEEMRLLYVAMTRAKEKLILTHVLTYGASELQKLSDSVDCPLSPQLLEDCSTVGQWIALAAMARPEGTALREAANASFCPPALEDFGPEWRIQYHRGSVSGEVEPAPIGEEAPSEPTEEEVQKMADLLTWQYPYAGAVTTPAKVTATQLKEGGEEFHPDTSHVFMEEPFPRPQFAQEELGLTAAQRGTALHLVLQNINLKKTGTLTEIQHECVRLKEEKFLTEQQAAVVDANAVLGFFSSPIGVQVRKNPTVQREYPFSVLVPAGQYIPDAPAGETILLQGVIDCWYESKEGITILDFKTDRILPNEMAQRAGRYRGQLQAYARALEEITGKPVGRKVLWFLTVNRGLDIP